MQINDLAVLFTLFGVIAILYVAIKSKDTRVIVPGPWVVFCFAVPAIVAFGLYRFCNLIPVTDFYILNGLFWMSSAVHALWKYLRQTFGGESRMK